VARLAVNAALRQYVRDRLAGSVTKLDGTRLAGPDVRWIGRRHGRRQDRRWAGSWSLEQVELATAEWVDWCNCRRVHSAVGDLPTAEFEALYYRQQQATAAA
jgi:transposase InsO family protein